MNEIIYFEFESSKVRSLIIDGEPWFIGKDIAEVLGYQNTRDALSKHIDNEDKGVANCDTLGGTQEMTIINESGLYALIFGSKLPKAKNFKRWVTSEVLPQLRKTGTYNINDVKESNPSIDDFMMSVTTALAEMSKVMSACVNAVCYPTTSKPEYDPNINYRKNQIICKIDTFPKELRNEVDIRITEMMNKSTLNLSSIARLCTARGHKISVPSVIKYFNRYFKK